MDLDGDLAPVAANDLTAPAKGPYTIMTSSNIYEKWGVYVQLFEAGATITYKLEGDVSYPGYMMNGPLHINIFDSVENYNTGTAMPGHEIIMYNPGYPAHYTFEGLSSGTYVIHAYVDANNDGEFDPEGGTDPVDPSGTYDENYSTPSTIDPINITDSDRYLPAFSIVNPGEETEGGTGGGEKPTGTNTVSGQISFSGSISASDRIIVRVRDTYSTWVWEQEMYGVGYYQISNLPNFDYGNCEVEAFVDYNWNWSSDFTEPQARSDPFTLTGSATKDLELQQQDVQKSTITITIRGKVYSSENQSSALSGALVRMYDTGGYEDWMPENDILVGSATTKASWSGSGYEQYNFEISSVTVYVNPDGTWPYWNYAFKISYPTFRMEQRHESFNTGEDGSQRYIDVMMEPKPTVSVENLTITPETISPDNDGVDDRANFSFKYSVTGSENETDRRRLGAQAKLVIDTNNDNVYSPMDWSVFVFIDGKEFIKVNNSGVPDPTIWIDYTNPDYTKLEGPLSWEDRDRYAAKFDATMDWWIDGWGLSWDGSKYYQNIEMMWEGRDNKWQALPNGTYKWKLLIDDPDFFDTTDGLLYSSSGTISLQTASIRGVVQDSDGNALEGVRVSAGGPGAWGESFSDENGDFEISGLRVSAEGDEFGGYHFEASKEGYVRQEKNNLLIPSDPGYYQFTSPIRLTKGIKVYGTVTIPEPPLRGTLTDSWGGTMWDLWGWMDAWKVDGPGWYNAEVRVELPTVSQSSISADYEIWLEPGNFEMQIQMPGYVSKTETVTITEANRSSGVNKNLTLTKSAVLTGKIKLPVSNSTDVENLIADAQKRGYWNNIWININGETKDRRNHSNTGVNFDFWELRNPPDAANAYTKDFRFDTLIPGTSYTVTVESQGLFAMKRFTVFMPSSGEKDQGVVSLDFGAALEGYIVLEDNIGEKIESKDWMSYMSQDMIPEEMRGKVPIWVDIRNTKYYTWHGIELYVSSTTFPGKYHYTVRGLSGGKHEIEVHGIRGVDIDPPLNERYVYVSTTTDSSAGITAHSASNPAQAPTIYVRKPSGILKGRITNSSGNNVDWNQVAVIVANIGSEGDMPGSYPVTPSADGSYAEFTANNLMTGEHLVWGTEYRVKPFDTDPNTGAPADFFGFASGNAGVFLKMVNTQSGGVTTNMTAELLPPASIKINIKGSAEIISDVVAKTTTYVYSPYGTRPSLCKVQPITLRKLGQYMEEMDQGSKVGQDEFKDDEEYHGTDAREIALSAEYSPSESSETNAVFNMLGLSEGIYFAYPLVNFKMFYGDEINEYGWRAPVYVEYKYASNPAEQYVVLQANQEKEVSFTLGEGVTLTGQIKRPASTENRNNKQTVYLALRSPVTNEVKYTQTLTYSTSTTQSDTLSFSFTKVSPPPSGKYIFVVQVLQGQALAYKVYSKTIEVTEASGTQNIGFIQLKKGATLKGRVVDSQGQGICSDILVECEAYPYVEGSYMNTDMAGVQLSSMTSTLGTFTFPNLPGGTYRVKASMKEDSKANYVTAVLAGITVPDSATTVETVGEKAIVLTMKNATSIQGIVKGATSKENSTLVPLGGMRVRAYPQDAQRRENRYLEAKTDKDGAFKVKGVDPSIQYWVTRINIREEDPTKKIERAVKYGSARRIVNLSTNTLITVTLPIADATVSGQVVTPDNSQLVLPFPIEGLMMEDFPAALVLVQSLSDLASGDPMAGIKMITKGNGEFSIDGIVAGDYTIKIFSKRFATYVSTMTIASGENDLGTITLEKGATVTGTIRTQSGTKISKNDANIVLAASKDFKNVVFGYLNANPSTLEVDSYEIVGLVPDVRYYIVLVNPETNRVYVDYKSTSAVAAKNGVYDYITHNVRYLKLPPMFKPKAKKLTWEGRNIKGGTLQYELTGGQTLTIEVPNMLEIIFDVDLSNVDFSSIEEDRFYDMYFTFVSATQPLMEDDVADVVSDTDGTAGVFVPLKMYDDRKSMMCIYIPDDTETETFQLKFTGTNSEGQVGSSEYVFYVGEDGRSEEILNPLMGGNISLGEGDGTGLEVPCGLEIEDDPDTPEDESIVVISTGVRVAVVKVTNVTASQTGDLQLSPKKYSPKAFSLKKVPSADSYPGDLYSDLYDMQVRLVAGPLASLAQNSSVGLTISLSTQTQTADIEKEYLQLYNYENGVWNAVEGATGDTISEEDWTAWINGELNSLLISAAVNSFSTFAVFYVPGGALSPAADNLDNVVVYPNPYKQGIANFDGANNVKGTINIDRLTAKAKIKIFNIAAELVYEASKDDPYDRFTWDMRNKDGDKVASGIYIYYITNPDVSGDKATGKFGIIK
ncbi:MAG: hypothetical protein JW871_07230 [Endomicrobiales bacterium]|nr:hypothetical protein [Endomicrobiales bacterium]